MTKLSVNINKFATLRNARGANNPNLLQVAQDCERFGAEGITVHPRPDERHIRFQDVLDLKPFITTEFNIEGNPNQRYVDLVLKTLPTQATLVPDAEHVLTSNEGWDTLKYQSFLREIVQTIQEKGIRVSIFVNPDIKMVEGAAQTGAKRIELYTGTYAHQYLQNPTEAISAYQTAAKVAQELGLEVNAGHDLDTQNLSYLKKNIPFLAEVSIGHALICDALYWGLENTIQIYKRQLKDYE
ncbi:MAG: pyridoxine 5'-phosphate synthase [Cytophagales bacterium]|nr:MAG: pyridoxine 5'-phosphate synthase [Cytophagales bacterium]